MDEYAERMGLAYPAVTYGDLDPLCADLPAAGPVIARPRAAPHAAAPPAVVSGARRARLSVCMKAVVYDRYGPPEVLRIEEVARPVPRDDELLVRVRAATGDPRA